jgi:aminopeptidase-like protein/aminoglycoside N3'-acetyltransferase
MLGIADGISTDDGLNRLFYDCIQEVLGASGTILVPTYSYTFGKSQAKDLALFDSGTTPAKTGPFPEFLRKQPGVRRSLDPMVSVSGIGPACEGLMAGLPRTSFGAGCIFDRLTHTKAKCCNIGLGPNFTPFLHYADWLAKVPFRYDKLFVGNMMIDNKLQKMSWVYAVRILSESSRANAHRLGKMAEERGIWKWVPLGRGRIYVAEYKDYFNFALVSLQKDPWLTAVGPAEDPIKLVEERVGTQVKHISLSQSATYIDIASELAPLVRETVSDGMDIALSALVEQLPMAIHRYPTGMSCFDWILPEKWTCHGASLGRMNGETVFSYAENPLFVRSYSLSYEGEVSRKDLLKHIAIHPTISKAVPYKQEFVDRDWGFCCSNEIRKSLTDDRYKVDIQTDFSYGELKVGEVMVPGNSSKTILICTYLDHPCQVNIALSGVLAGMGVIRARIKAKESRFSYRLLVLPGATGFAAWVSQHKALIPRILGGVSLRMLARSLPHIMQHSSSGNTILDTLCERELKKRDSASQIVSANEVFNEFPGGGNPLYDGSSSWGNIPMVSLARALPIGDLDFPFRGYLTDLDSLENADFNAIKETCSIVKAIFNVLEDT